MDFLPSSRQTQSASVRYESRRAQRSHPSLKTVLTRLYICGGSYFCKRRNSPSHRVSRTFWKSEKPEFCLMFRLNKKEQLKHPCCRGESVRPGVSFSESVIWFIYRPVRAHKVPLWSHYITLSYIIMKLKQNLSQSVRVEHIESDPLSETPYELFFFFFVLRLVHQLWEITRLLLLVISSSCHQTFGSTASQTCH